MRFYHLAHMQVGAYRLGFAWLAWLSDAVAYERNQMNTQETLLMLDCDGTLLDTIGAWHQAERHVAERAGAVLTKDERDELNTLTLEEVGTFFHDRYGLGAGAADVMQMINDFMIDFYRTRSSANPGALEFVKAAHAAGVAMCVLSSSPLEFLQVGLGRCGFLPYVGELISVEEIGMTKRNPATYPFVCERMGCSPDNSWLFDDSWYALEAARKAGLRTVGVFSTDLCGTHDQLAEHAEVVADTFDELDRALFGIL